MSGNYSYTKTIKKPEEMGISNKYGNDNISTDFNTLVKYVDLLILGEAGDESASNLKVGQSLGDSYFLESTIQCETKDGEEVNRNFYVDNRTVTNGFLPSTIESIGQLTAEIPKMFTIFNEIGPQKCKYTEKTVVSQNDDGSNNKTTQTKPIKETFRNINFNILNKPLKEKIPHAYILTVGLFFTYILFNLSLKKK